MTGPTHPRTFGRRPAGTTPKPAATWQAPETVAPPERAAPPAAPPPKQDAPPAAAPPKQDAPAPPPAAAPPAAPPPPAAAPPAAPPPARPATAKPETQPARRRRRLPFWVLKPIIGLLIAIAAIVVMVRVVGRQSGVTVPFVAPVSTTSTAPAPAGAQAGTITVGGVFLLPLTSSVDSAGSLGARTGLVVQAQGVQVLSTPTADGAWVGTSTDNRVYVQQVEQSASGVGFAVGQRLSFTGNLVANPPSLPGQVGDGADLLTRLGQHVEVFRGAVTVAA